jgi:NitT/TauT family transport system substrate-binding protein
MEGMRRLGMVFLISLAAFILTPLICSTGFAEKKLPEKYWKTAAKYGTPTDKYGKPGEPISLTVGYQPYCAPYWTSSVIKQLELWKKYLPEGSSVIWFRSLSGPLINANMVAGKNQIGYMAATPGLRSLDTVPCEMVQMTGYDNGQTGGVVVNEKLVETGKVKEPKDLEGRKAGTPFGSYSHRQALTFQDDFDVKMRLFDNIDAAIEWEPYPEWIGYRKLGKVMWTGMDMASTRKKWLPESYKEWPTSFRVNGCTLMIFDLLKSRPDVVVAWLKAEEEAREILNYHKDLATYVIWADISEVPQPVIRADLDMMTWDGRINPKTKEKLVAMARQWRAPKSEGGAGILSNDRSKDPKAFVEEGCDDTFLRIAMDELKAEGRWTSYKTPGFPTMLDKKFEEHRAHWEDYGKSYEAKIYKWEPGKYSYK